MAALDATGGCRDPGGGRRRYRPAASRPRHLAAQHGHARNLALKLIINGAAVAATAGTWAAGSAAGPGRRGAGGGCHRAEHDTPAEAAGAQRGLRVLQWVVPALTGAHIVMNAMLDE
jgi:hypothetical protein